MKITPIVKPVTEEGGNYGNLHLNSKFCKGIPKLKLGEEFEVDVKVKVTELHAPNAFEITKLKLKPTDVIVHFEIVGVEELGEEIMEMKMEKMAKGMGKVHGKKKKTPKMRY